MIEVFRPKPAGALISDLETLSLKYGTKGAYLTVFPTPWTAEYVLLSAEDVALLADGYDIGFSVPVELSGMPIIVRSSIVGETIWDRGTYESISHPVPPSDNEVLASIISIHAHAISIRADLKVGIVLQRFVQVSEKGQLGNLNRLSKTREQWSLTPETEYSALALERFNTQRDPPFDPRRPLDLRAAPNRGRVFGSACRWLNDRFAAVQKADRMLLEWGIADDRLYLLQLDLDSDNDTGTDPEQLSILNRLAAPSILPKVLRVPEDHDIRLWDKLKIIDDLASDAGPPPQRLFVLTAAEAATALSDDQRRTDLALDFDELCDTFAMIRTTSKVEAPKTTNLPVTTGCIGSKAAIEWLQNALLEIETKGNGVDDFAFVVHKFMGARSGAWALYDPGSPYIQIHANWGLPDALQYYPYDSWEVHLLTEDVIESPAYKTNFL